MKKARGRVPFVLAAFSMAVMLAVPATGAGAATSSTVQPGVTSSTIDVGNVATVTGPVPGLFEGAQVGTEAYFAYIDSLGGVGGRKLVLKTGDDAYSCSQNQSVTRSDDRAGLRLRWLVLRL